MVYQLLMRLADGVADTFNDLYIITVLDFFDALQQQFPRLLTDTETLYSWTLIVIGDNALILAFLVV